MTTELNNKLLNEFWENHASHWPDKDITDFDVRWREGYAFYYEIIDKSTGKYVMRVHADVVDPNTDPMIIANEIAKATAQISVTSPDLMNGPPKTNKKPKSVQEWLDETIDQDEDL